MKPCPAISADAGPILAFDELSIAHRSLPPKGGRHEPSLRSLQIHVTTSDSGILVSAPSENIASPSPRFPENLRRNWRGLVFCRLCPRACRPTPVQFAFK